MRRPGKSICALLRACNSSPKASELLILFDKNVPYQIRRYLVNHNVRTTAEQGWSRLTNGELLKIAEAEKFDVMVTADQNLSYQQNLKDRLLALVVLGTNRLSLLEAQTRTDCRGR